MAFNEVRGGPMMENIPNFTGASQGTGPNRTFETLFEGIGTTLRNAANMQDTMNIQQIENEARQGFDALNEEFGLDIPAGVTDFEQKAQALQAAFEQGKLSQVNYYGRMAAMAKQVRQRYPGYESEVDRAIQSVTGTRPANAYRDAILSEMERAQSEASNEEKFRRQWTKENEAELAILYGPEYFQNPEAYPNAQAEVAQFKGERELIKAEKEKLDLAAKQGDFNTTKAEKLANQEANLLVTTGLNSALKVNNPDFTKTVNELIAKGGGTPQEQEQFIGQITEAEAVLRAKLMTQLRARYGNHLPLERLNKIIEDALYPVTSIKESVLGGDFKLAGRLAHLNKAMKDQQMNELLKDQGILAGVGLKEISETLGEEYFANQINDVHTIALEAAGRVLVGQKGTIAKVIDEGNNKVSREVVNQSIKMITDPNLSGEKFSNLVNEFFGQDGSQKDFMDSSVVAQEDLSKMYAFLVSPQVTQAIITKGTPEDLQKYTAWALEKAPAIKEIKDAAGDVNKTSRYFKELGAFINPKTGTIEFSEAQGLRPGDPALQTAGMVYKSVQDLNKVLTLLRPIFEAQGLDAVTGTQQYLQSLGVSIGGEYFKNLNDAIQGSEGQENVQGSAGSDTLEEVDIDEIDFMTTSAYQDEPESFDASGLPNDFVDPRSNPDVDPQVLARFKGRRLPAALRLNNMGAVSIVGKIEGSFGARQPGFVGVVPRPKNEGGYYAQYATPEHGVAAASKLLERYGKQGINTATKITKKWAAEPGNYPNVLVKYLREAGYEVDKNTPLNLSDPGVRKAILKAKSAHESGAGRPTYAEAVFDRGVTM